MLRFFVGPRRGPARQRALWDVVMLVLAVFDLAFIGFDLSYLYLRPVYFDVAPAVVRLYDPVKGMRPHPTSQRLLEHAAQTRAYLETSARDAGNLELAEQVQVLRHLTLRILREDAFGRSEDAYLEDVFREVVGRSVGVDPADLAYPPTQRAAVQELWPTDRMALLPRLNEPSDPLLHALRANYFRDVELAGEPVDYFPWLELPLLALFWMDFWLGWVIAVRSEPGRPWFRYLLLHWYDLLGLLPGKLRLFRLLRLVSLYLRIYRGELRQVRDNVVKRLSYRISEALVEEVTNRVQIRVVQRLETELTEETIQRSLASSLARQQSEIVELMIDQVHHMVSDPETQSRVRELVSLTTNEALSSRRSWPFARDLTRSVADRAVVSVLEAFAQTLQTDHGRNSLRQLLLTSSQRARGRDSFRRLQEVASCVSLEVVRAVGVAAEQRTWTAAGATPPAAGVAPSTSVQTSLMSLMPSVSAPGRRRRGSFVESKAAVRDLQHAPAPLAPRPRRTQEEERVGLG